MGAIYNVWWKTRTTILCRRVRKNFGNFVADRRWVIFSFEMSPKLFRGGFFLHHPHLLHSFYYYHFFFTAFLYGRTDNNKLCFIFFLSWNFPSEKCTRVDQRRVEILRSFAFELFGVRILVEMAKTTYRTYRMTLFFFIFLLFVCSPFFLCCAFFSV